MGRPLLSTGDLREACDSSGCLVMGNSQLDQLWVSVVGLTSVRSPEKISSEPLSHDRFCVQCCYTFPSHVLLRVINILLARAITTCLPKFRSSLAPASPIWEAAMPSTPIRMKPGSKEGV